MSFLSSFLFLLLLVFFLIASPARASQVTVEVTIEGSEEQQSIRPAEDFPPLESSYELNDASPSSSFDPSTQSYVMFVDDKNPPNSVSMSEAFKVSLLGPKKLKDGRDLWYDFPIAIWRKILPKFKSLTWLGSLDYKSLSHRPTDPESSAFVLIPAEKYDEFYSFPSRVFLAAMEALQNEKEDKQEELADEEGNNQNQPPSPVNGGAEKSYPGVTMYQRFLLKARDSAAASGHVFPQHAACEAALESNYGLSKLARQGNNLFGQKATPGYSTITMVTGEFLRGRYVRVNAPFARFPSQMESFRARMNLLKRLSGRYPNYAKALAAKDGEDFLFKVSKTWATDPYRGSKAVQICRKNASLFARFP